MWILQSVCAVNVTMNIPSSDVVAFRAFLVLPGVFFGDRATVGPHGQNIFLVAGFPGLDGIFL